MYINILTRYMSMYINKTISLFSCKSLRCFSLINLIFRRSMRQPMEIMMLIFFLCCLLAFTVVVQGQFESGFISVDCGLAQGSSYSDAITELQYSSDEEYVDTGINANISPDFNSNSLPRHMSSVRSFPQGINNCYTFKPDQVVAAKDNKYLIRAIFMYGNYDSKNQPPQFGLYLDVNEWDTVKLKNASVIVTKEIIHMPTSDYIHVCLVNTGSGTPFISALELRKLDNSTYVTDSGSLVLRRRLDFGSTTNTQYRYKDDVYDRIWESAGEMANMESVSVLDTSITDLRDADNYKAPYSVMRTAVRPVSGSRLDYYYRPPDSSKGFYFYEYFAEVEKLQANQYREFNTSDHDIDKSVYDKIHPTYLSAFTVFSKEAEYAEDRFQLSIYSTDDSTLPPILNALEIYEVKDFPQSPTHQIEVDAMMLIKTMYGVKKNWQGDPCVPRNYSWEGISCRYDGENYPTIISLNLSSNGLSGNIATSLSKLKSLQSLDLSNNSLTGPVPVFLSQMSQLLRINLSRNKLSGSVPADLIEKNNNESLQSFSADGNPKLCDTTTSTCKKKKNVIILVVVSVVSFLVLVSALAILWSFKRRKQQGTRNLGKPKKENEALEPKARQFTFSEVVNITSNFTRVLGKGGFGTVYGGNLEDGTQVAVKMLSSSSTQGSKEFRAEAQLLTTVHHRNLVSFVGYCNEGERKGLIYEYMANGSLQDHLSEKNAIVLSWGQRIRIAVDAAQGLEYLHNGCNPQIIHRDVKTSNILLNDKMQAKVSDFGLSKFLSPDGGSHISTTVVGTPGYLDPEYYVSNWLNEKSDVYSFGILLLELITGRPAIIKVHENQLHIVKWVKAILERGEIRSIMDSRLKEEELEMNSVWKVVETAMACVQDYSIQRPTMSHVLVELKECLELEMAAERNSMSTTNLHVSTNSLVIDFESSVGPHAR